MGLPWQLTWVRARTISLMGAEREDDALGWVRSACLRFGFGFEDSWLVPSASAAVDLFGMGSDFLALGLAVPLAAAAVALLAFIGDLTPRAVEEADFLMLPTADAFLSEVDVEADLDFAFVLAGEDGEASESSERESPSSKVRSTRTDDCFEPAMMMERCKGKLAL